MTPREALDCSNYYDIMNDYQTKMYEEMKGYSGYGVQLTAPPKEIDDAVRRGLKQAGWQITLDQYGHWFIEKRKFKLPKSSNGFVSFCLTTGLVSSMITLLLVGIPGYTAASATAATCAIVFSVAGIFSLIGSIN